ncbi:unnamed protein product, partial [Brassica rapa]
DSPRGPKSPEHSTVRASVLSPRTSVLICVLMDSHGRPVCADGHTQTHKDTQGHTRTATDVLCVMTDSHGQPRTSCVCWRTPTDVLRVLNRQPTLAKITQTVHGKGQRAESRTSSKDQRADMCTDGQPRPSFLCVLTDTHGHTRRTHTDVLCVLTDTHGCPVCADRQPWIATDVRCVLADTHGHTRTHTDSHGRPVCADGQPQTSCVCWQTPTDVLCFKNRQPTWAKIPKQSTGSASVLSTRTNVLICVVMDSHRRSVC